MRYLLSIRTGYPKSGAKIWYDDQREVHKQIYEGQDSVAYAFMGQNPDAADNIWLREALEAKIPFIYFLGVSPVRYQAIIPAFVSGWDRQALKADVAFGVAGQSEIAADGIERRYALRQVQQRSHQASFRDAVITAYRGRCALSGLPEALLLDAAHIISDGNEQLGQPVVSNGIPLSKIHHAAFDAHLIGIDPSFKVHVSERLRSQNDGPMLDALKKLHLGQLHLPQRPQDQPDRDRLALRFESFLAAA
jgi:putative restriction endonuclease